MLPTRGGKWKQANLPNTSFLWCPHWSPCTQFIIQILTFHENRNHQLTLKCVVQICKSVEKCLSTSLFDGQTLPMDNQIKSINKLAEFFKSFQQPLVFSSAWSEQISSSSCFYNTGQLQGKDRISLNSPSFSETQRAPERMRLEI